MPGQRGRQPDPEHAGEFRHVAPIMLGGLVPLVERELSSGVAQRTRRPPMDPSASKLLGGYSNVAPVNPVWIPLPDRPT